MVKTVKSTVFQKEPSKNKKIIYLHILMKTPQKERITEIKQTVLGVPKYSIHLDCPHRELLTLCIPR